MNFAIISSPEVKENLRKGTLSTVVQVEDERKAYVSFGYKTGSHLNRTEISYPAQVSAKDVLKC